MSATATENKTHEITNHRAISQEQQQRANEALVPKDDSDTVQALGLKSLATGLGVSFSEFATFTRIPESELPAIQIRRPAGNSFNLFDILRDLRNLNKVKLPLTDHERLRKWKETAFFSKDEIFSRIMYDYENYYRWAYSNEGYGSTLFFCRNKAGEVVRVEFFVDDYSHLHLRLSLIKHRKYTDGESVYVLLEKAKPKISLLERLVILAS